MRLLLFCFTSFWIAIAHPVTAQIAAQITPSVAGAVLDSTLTLRSADGRDAFLGSGVIFGARDQVLTNAHVVGKAIQVNAITRDGSQIRADVVAIDHGRDLALLRLETPASSPITPAQIDSQVGQAVYAAGAPLEASFTLTAGIVSALGKQIDPAQPVAYLQHSAPVNPGSSGGPLVNAAGELIGINTRISDGSRFFVGIAYAVPLAEIVDFVANGPQTVWPAAGMQLRPLTPRIRAALGYVDQGSLIEQVNPDTPADRAGLAAGDILIAVNGRKITTPGDLAFALAAGGQELKITYVRAGAQHDATLSRAAAQTGLQIGTTQAPERQKQYKLTDMGMVLNSDGTIRGVVAQGAGYFAGLNGGDRIAAIDGVTLDQLPADWMRSYTFDAPILLRIVLSDGGTRHYVMDPWEAHSGLRLSSSANILDAEVVNFD